MYKVLTYYKNNETQLETYESYRDAVASCKEECTYQETRDSIVYNENRTVIFQDEGWL